MSKKKVPSRLMKAIKESHADLASIRNSVLTVITNTEVEDVWHIVSRVPSLSLEKLEAGLKNMDYIIVPIDSDRDYAVVISVHTIGEPSMVVARLKNDGGMNHCDIKYKVE